MIPSAWRLWLPLAALLLIAAEKAPPPTVEFGSPYEVRILPGGTVVQLSGSFSWAVPQNFEAMLAQAPNARVVRLESPGGHVRPALEVAAIIHARGLDTYVGGFCASACTLAFLAGRQRWVAAEARLGFHQAYAPGVPPEQFDAPLHAAYARSGVPEAFIAHVLRTPPRELWYPTTQELRASGLVTGAAPEAVAASGAQRGWQDVAALLPVAPDGAVEQFAVALLAELAALQVANAELCWGFAHMSAADIRPLVPQKLLDDVAAAADRVADEARRAPVAAPDVAVRRAAVAELVGAMRVNGGAAVLAGLRADADHAAFCPALQGLLRAALALPDGRRGMALRALLSRG